MAGRAPSRFPSGVSTGASLRGPMADVGFPDPRRWHVYWDDFNTYAAANWTVTETQAAATEALADVDGGCLLVTNSAADDDAVSMQLVGEGFLLEAGKRAVFACRFKVSDVTQSDLQVGLVITDTTSLDATDGVYFQKDDGDAFLDVVCRKNATTGSTGATAIATLVADTFVDVAWYYNGSGKVYYYVDNLLAGSLDGSSSYLPDTELTVTLYLQNGEGAAKTMTVDYVLAAKERW